MANPFPVFKKALADALVAVLPNSASYGSPQEFSDIMGLDGSGIGIWWADEAPFDTNVDVVTGSTQWFDLNAEPVLIIQVVGLNTTDDAYAVDARAWDAFDKVSHILATDPTVAMTLYTSGYRGSYATPGQGRYVTGVDSQNMRGGRIELSIRFHTRLTP